MSETINGTIFLGIHVWQNRRPFTYAMIDSNLRIRCLEQGQMAEVLAFAASEEMQVISINAPSKVNQGLINDDDWRLRLNPVPADGRYTNMRLVEYELHKKGFKVARTAALEGECPEWMWHGFLLYNRLRELGFEQVDHETSRKFYLETNAEAAFYELLGHHLLDGTSLEGRVQRQLILLDQKMPLADPLQSLEEITRFRLLSGQPIFKQIRSLQELNALVCAYTAWLSYYYPNKIITLGPSEEGVISLPTRFDRKNPEPI